MPIYKNSKCNILHKYKGKGPFGQVKIMEDRRTEQIEALQTLAEYNQKVLKNIPILVRELKGERLEDTDKFLKAIVNAINWEVEVLNATLDVINEKEKKVSKEKVNDKILALSEALKAQNENEQAEAFEQLVPELENIEQAIREVIA